jgi:hypothetical protein
MSNPEDKANKKTFTGEKLDWLNLVNADPRLDASAFKVAFCIAQHINQNSGTWMLSDELISDKTSLPTRTVQRARKALRDLGWINWRRTGGANVYWLLNGQVNAMLDHLTMLKDARNEKRIKARASRCMTPPMANLKRSHSSPVANADLPSVTLPTRR